MHLYPRRRNVAAQVVEELQTVTYATIPSYGGTQKKKIKKIQMLWKNIGETKSLWTATNSAVSLKAPVLVLSCANGVQVNLNVIPKLHACMSITTRHKLLVTQVWRFDAIWVKLLSVVLSGFTTVQSVIISSHDAVLFYTGSVVTKSQATIYTCVIIIYELRKVPIF